MGPMAKELRKMRDGREGRLPRIAVVVSRYNATVTDRLLEGAVREHRVAGGGGGGGLEAEGLYIAEAAGAFELVAIASAAAQSGAFAGVLALGCIIKGETRHDEFLGHAVTQGLANISLMTGVPVGLGVLTVNTPKQALERAGGKQGNKGAEAMGALLQTIGEVAILSDPGQLEAALASGSAMKRALGRVMRGEGLGRAGSGSPDKLAKKRAAAGGGRR